MHPDALKAQTEQATLFRRLVEHVIEREFAGRRIVELSRRQDRRSRINEGDNFAFAATAQGTIRCHRKIAPT